MRRTGHINNPLRLLAIIGLHRHIHFARIQIEHHFGLCLPPILHRLLIHRFNAVARLETGLCRNRCRLHHTHPRADVGNAKAEAGAKQHNRQHQIGNRPGGHNRHALGRMLAVKRVGQIGLGHIAFARVYHFNVAAQRNRR